MLNTFKVNYDLEAHLRSHEAFIRHATAEGWSVWTDLEDGTTRRLPATSLKGEFVTIAAAEAAFVRALQATSRELGSTVRCTKFDLGQQEGRAIVYSDEIKPTGGLAQLGMGSIFGSKSIADLANRIG